MILSVCAPRFLASMVLVVGTLFGTRSAEAAPSTYGITSPPVARGLSTMLEADESTTQHVWLMQKVPDSKAMHAKRREVEVTAAAALKQPRVFDVDLHGSDAMEAYDMVQEIASAKKGEDAAKPKRRETFVSSAKSLAVSLLTKSPGSIVGHVAKKVVPENAWITKHVLPNAEVTLLHSLTLTSWSSRELLCFLVAIVVVQVLVIRLVAPLGDIGKPMSCMA